MIKLWSNSKDKWWTF